MATNKAALLMTTLMGSVEIGIGIVGRLFCGGKWSDGY
jgi:hypothetical protein